MLIGYACVTKGTPYRTNRRFKLENFSEEVFYEKLENNLEDLMKILEYNVRQNCFLFRISSDIVPFGSHENNVYDWQKKYQNELNKIGQFIRNNHIRVSMHPGQYTVLNSPNQQVVEKSVEELIYHCNFLDALGMNSSHKLILHVGGIYDDKEQAKKRLVENYVQLPQNVKNRLTLENDEKNYSIEDLFDIYEHIKVPLIFDILHHRIYHSINKGIFEILKSVQATWKTKDGNMKIHYSQQDPLRKIGSHSKTIHVNDFLEDYDQYFKAFNPDIMLEVKDKDISAIKCNLLFRQYHKSKKDLYDQWAKYKYLVMEKDYALYKEVSSLVDHGVSFADFFNRIDEILMLPNSKKAFYNTLLHVWGYIKNQVLERERNHFLNL